MQYANDSAGEKILARKDLEAWCPSCGKEVVPKCGRIVVHHWAHKAEFDCDPWFEPETVWHRGWKELAPAHRVEVPMGEHRADIVLRNGSVLELQNSAISPQEIAAREDHYREMAWLLNGASFMDRLFLLEPYGNGRTFKLRWKQQRECWRHAGKPVLIDLCGEGLQRVLGKKSFVYSGHDAFGGRHNIVPAPERAKDLPEWQREPVVLRINTLHATGWGSVTVIPRLDLIRKIVG